MNKKVLIIGGGPAGLIAAATAAADGARVTVLERNERPVRKLLLTGKGRCNLTNSRCETLEELTDNVPVNGKFLYSAFSRFMPSDVMELFESLGVPLKTERGGRVFPVSDRAMDIADALVAYAARSGVKTYHGRAEKLIIEDGAVIGVTTFDGDTLYADAVIVATGGKSYPVTGSTGDGYELAAQAGHNIITPKPSLVPLCVHEGFCSRLQGLSLRNVELQAVDNTNSSLIYKGFGEMLFTHFGVSGPLVLSASSHMRAMSRGRYSLLIDLKPALTPEQLDHRLLSDFSDVSNKNFINSLNSLFPKKLVPVMVKLSGIPADTKVNQITREQRTRLAEITKGLHLTVTDFRPVEEAIITSGGVDVAQIDPKTMRSRLVEGLYFAGEVIDADAYTGGFNLQIAFSTGVLAGMSAADTEKIDAE